jgi:hypothetical protein
MRPLPRTREEKKVTRQGNFRRESSDFHGRTSSTCACPFSVFFFFLVCCLNPLSCPVVAFFAFLLGYRFSFSTCFFFSFARLLPTFVVKQAAGDDAAKTH